MRDRPPNSPRIKANAAHIVAVAGGASFDDSDGVSEVGAADGRDLGLPDKRNEPPALPDLTAAPGATPPAVTATNDLEFAAPQRAGPATAAGRPGAGRSDRPAVEDEDDDEEELPTEPSP